MTFFLLYFTIQQILERLQKCDTTHGDLHGSASSDVCDGDRYIPVPITSMRSSFNKCFPFLWSPAHMLCPTGLAMREPEGNKLLLLYMPSAPDMWWQIKAPWIFGTAMWRAFEICLKSITTWQNASLTQYALRCFAFLRCVWDILRMVFDESGRLSGFSEPLLHMPPGKRLWGLQHVEKCGSSEDSKAPNFTSWNHEIWGSTKLLPSFRRRRMEGWQVHTMWEFVDWVYLHVS